MIKDTFDCLGEIHVPNHQDWLYTEVISIEDRCTQIGGNQVQNKYPPLPLLVKFIKKL